MEQNKDDDVNPAAVLIERSAILHSLHDVRRAAEKLGLRPFVVTQMSSQLDGNDVRDLPVISMRGAVKDAVQLLHARYESKLTLTGLATGFVDFDQMTLGLQPGELIVLAGRPGTGCSALGLNIVEYVACKAKTAALIFSTDVSPGEIGLRLISSLGLVPLQDLRSGDLGEFDWPRVTSAITTLAGARIFIIDSRTPSIAEIRKKSYQMMLEHDLGLIIIDNLQSIKLPGTLDSRATEIRDILGGLKTLAQALGIPVLAISRLGGFLECRENQRLVMADFGEWAAIETHADVIAFLYRDKDYNLKSAERGVSEIHIARQRNGPVGSIRLTFFDRYNKFENSSTNDCPENDCENDSESDNPTI